MQVRRKGLEVVAASLLFVAVGAASVGCAKKEDDTKAAPVAPPATTPPPPAAPPPPAVPPPAAPAPAAPPPAAPASDVTRYPDERPVGKPGVLVNAVGARKQARAEAVVTDQLAKGTAVNLVAQSGNWTLVGWRDAGGDRMGWVESAKAFGGIDSRQQNALDEGRRRGVLFPR